MNNPHECGVTFPEALAFPYPPLEHTEESVAESEDEDDSEDGTEGKYDYLSASEEGEDEILARAASLAKLDTINDGEDSTDEEELLDSDEDDGKNQALSCSKACHRNEPRKTSPEYSPAEDYLLS